jgi:hypothetical protein
VVAVPGGRHWAMSLGPVAASHLSLERLVPALVGLGPLAPVF